MRERKFNRTFSLAVVCCLAVAGCGSSTGLGLSASKSPATSTTASGGNSSMTGMSGMTTTTGSGATAQMNMGSGSAGAPPNIKGVPRPVASQVLSTSYWQGMEIQARTMTPIPFLTVTGNANGVTEHMVKPPKGSSFHLMVMLTDEHTGEAIPYASVWATITNNKGFDWTEQQWPMISRYMGPHYGNDVPHLKPGRYKLTLLVSPPLSARHIEYQHVWLKKHTVTTYFNWKTAA